MHYIYKKLAASLLIAAASVCGLAIVPGQETTDFPWTGKIGPLTGFNTGATCVGDHWLITAGHVVFGQTQMRFRLDDGRTYDSIAIFHHPTDDIALVEVAETFPGWYDIYWSTNQIGKTLEMVGYGVTGTFDGTRWQYSGEYGTKRRGRNRVATTQMVQFMGDPPINGDFMICDFDGGGIDQLGEGGPLENEATLGGLDSGSPSFILDGGVLKVAGVHSWVGSVTGGPQPPQYGSVFGDVRLSTYRSWYDSIVPAEVLPATMSLFRGSIVSGNLASLFRSEDNRLVLRPGAVFSSSERPIQLILEGVSPVTSTTELRFAFEGSATAATIEKRIELFNFSTGQYQVFNTSNSTTTDSVTEIIVTANPSQYIQAGTGAVRARISGRALTPQFQYPWLFRIDRAVWNIKR